MAYRDSRLVGTGAQSTAQIALPALTAAGDVLVLVASQTQSTTTRDFTLTDGNGQTWSTLTTMQMVGSNGQWRAWARTAVSGDANANVTVAGGVSSGRWILTAVALSGMNLGTLTSAIQSSGSGGATITAPAGTAASGASGGDVLRYYLATLSSAAFDYHTPTEGTIRQEGTHTTTSTPNGGQAVTSATFTGTSVGTAQISVTPDVQHRAGFTVLVRPGPRRR